VFAARLDVQVINLLAKVGADRASHDILCDCSQNSKRGKSTQVLSPAAGDKEREFERGAGHEAALF
jgi:hypothetical protein